MTTEEKLIKNKLGLLQLLIINGASIAIPTNPFRALIRLNKFLVPRTSGTTSANSSDLP